MIKNTVVAKPLIRLRCGKEDDDIPPFLEKLLEKEVAITASTNEQRRSSTYLVSDFLVTVVLGYSERRILYHGLHLLIKLNSTSMFSTRESRRVRTGLSAPAARLETW